MAKCFRHFNALMRKNFILWIRAWGCSTFEVLAPIVVMIGLTIIRNQIPQVSVTQEGMLEKKYPAYPGVGKDADGWCDSTHCDDWLKDAMVPLAAYANYTEKHERETEGAHYDPAWDWHGPQFWAPGHCIRTSDWATPKKPSPYIGHIGAQTNMTD